jgi:hypothetical protein
MHVPYGVYHGYAYSFGNERRNRRGALPCSAELPEPAFCPMRLEGRAGGSEGNLPLPLERSGIDRKADCRSRACRCVTMGTVHALAPRTDAGRPTTAAGAVLPPAARSSS